MNFPFVRQVARTAWLAAVVLSLLLPAARAEIESPLTVEIIGGGTVKPDYNGQVLTNSVKYSMTAKPKKGFKFAGWSGDLTSSKPKLTFTNSPGLASLTATFVDSQPPTVTINAVPGSGALTNDTLYTGGTARDNDAVTNVQCRVISGGTTNDWQPAGTYNNWSNWWFSATIVPGTNWLEACAVDASGLVSKISRLKLIYTIAPASLSGFTATITDPENGDEIVEVLDFGTDTFTGITGAGGYTFKKTSSVNGQLKLSWAAPPSADGPAAKINLQFSTATEGTLTDANGMVYDFSLTENSDWAPANLNGADIVLAYNDSTNQVALQFPEPPTVDTNEIPALQNPYTIPLESDYPGQPGDRVRVTFLHERYVGSASSWVQYPPKDFTGSVIDIGDGTVTVLFDAPPKNGQGEYFVLAALPLNILTCGYTTPATNGTALFAYTQSSPAGALLQLYQGGTNKYLIFNFTSADTEGTFYQEDYLNGNVLVATNGGTFAIALPPQISSQPQDVAITSNNVPASFTVAAQGTAPLTYQWRFNGTNLVDGITAWGSIIAGSTTTNLVLSSVTNNDIGSYQVLVSNAFGSATSRAAQLTAAPAITAQPTNFTYYVTNDISAGFNITAIGVPPLTYQWQFNGTNLTDGSPSWGSVIAGTSSTNLSIGSVHTNDAGNYRVIVNNSFGSVTSSVARLIYVNTNSLPIP